MTCGKPRGCSGLWIGAVALMLASCGKVVGIDEYSVGGDLKCGGFALPHACNTCIASECCTEADACRGDPKCSEFEDCWAACKNDECRYECFENHRKSPAAGALLSCMTTQCSTSCMPDRCFDVGAAMAPGCNACLIQKDACSPIRACRDDPECLAFRTCILRDCAGWLGDPACRLACATAHPDFRTAYLPVAKAVGDCGLECALGTHWECVDAGASSSFQTGNSGQTADVVLHINDFISGPIFGDIQTSWCQGSPENCDVSALTDPSGAAVLAGVPQSTATYALVNGHFEWTLYPDHGTVGVPVSFFPGVPFAGPRIELTSIPVAPPSSPAPPPGQPLIFAVMGDCLGSTDTTSPNGPGTTLCLAPDSSSDCLDPIAYVGGKPSGSIAWFSPVASGSFTVVGKSSDGTTLARSTLMQIEANRDTVVFLNYPSAEY